MRGLVARYPGGGLSCSVRHSPSNSLSQALSDGREIGPVLGDGAGSGTLASGEHRAYRKTERFARRVAERRDRRVYAAFGTLLGMNGGIQERLQFRLQTRPTFGCWRRGSTARRVSPERGRALVRWAGSRSARRESHAGGRVHAAAVRSPLRSPAAVPRPSAGQRSSRRRRCSAPPWSAGACGASWVCS